MLRGSLSASGHHLAIVASALTAGSVAGPARADPFVFADSFEAGLTWSMFQEAVAGNPCGASTGGEVSVAPGGLDGGHGLRVYANEGETLKANHLIAQRELLELGPYGNWSMSTWVWVDAESIGSTQTGPEFSLQNTRPIGLVGGDGVQRWRTLTAGVQYVGSEFDANQGWRVWGIVDAGPEADSEKAGWLAMDTPLRFEESGWYELSLSVDYDALAYGSLSIRRQEDEEATVVPLEGVSLAREVKFIEGGLQATLEAENLSDCNTATGHQYSATQNPVLYDDVWIEQTAGVIHAPPEAQDLLIDGHLGDSLVYELEDLAYDPDGDLDPSTLRVVEAPFQGVVDVDQSLGTLTHVATGFGFKYRVCDATYLCAEAWIYPGWGVSRSGTEEWTGLRASNDALSSLRFGEFNGDDTADVFRADGSKWWISASGTDDWTQLNVSGYTVGSLAFADFDDNGSTDVFRANGSKWWVSWAGAGPWVELNTASETLGSLRFAHFDDDGSTDVFRADGTKWWVSWSGASPWSQLNTSSYTVGSLAFADFDGDRKSEVLRTDGSKWWVSWSGTGPWSQLNTSGYTVGSLAFADFNDDGDADVFRADGTKWWVSLSGTSPWSQLNSSTHTLEHLVLHDFDGDGTSDVFRAWY